MSSKDIARNPLDSFVPAPGYILLETIKDPNDFKPVQDDAPDDADNLRGKVLKIGNAYTNDFGTLMQPPPIKEEDEILFRWEYNNDHLEIAYKVYPVIKFSQFRGKL